MQIGGSAQTARAQVMPGGIQTPFDFNMTVQLQNMVDDIENSCYYGLAQAPTADSGTPDTATTAKMNGLRAILQTNNTDLDPVNASAYGSSDLIRDTLQAARQNGGEPDLLVVSTNFMSGFATWGQAIQRVPAGETVFGTPINVLEAPFLHGVTIVEAPLLRPYTAIALTSSEVYIRNKRNPYWNLRGNRGDMVEGDWIAEMAIEVVNESHHAWVEGITAFSRELIFSSVVSCPWSVRMRLSGEVRHRTRHARLRRTAGSQPDAEALTTDNGQLTTDKHACGDSAARRIISISRQEGWASPRSWPTAPGTTRRSTASPCSWPSFPTAITRRGKRTASRVFCQTELAQVKGTLEQCEHELQKLHMLAAASDAMLADAWQAFGFPKQSRIFGVYTAVDTFTLPLGDGTVGVPDDVDEASLTCAAEA